MSIDLLEAASTALDDLLPEVVFVGGATVELWITDPAAPPVRPTKDVDVVVEVASRSAFYDFETRLRAHGFREDQEDGVICRWRHDTSDLILDAMPSKASILGFENYWQGAGAPHAITRELPSGTTIRALSPPYLLATKLEAFRGRGREDFLASRDFADIIALVDGRQELIAEVAASGPDLRAYVAHAIDALLKAPRFPDGLFGAFGGDATSQERGQAVVLPALRSLTQASPFRRPLR
ncbi:MAG: nucleotidyl transferase AbiEii/AbiGii toxin family protein [Solirubrobacterales bacterium]